MRTLWVSMLVASLGAEAANKDAWYLVNTANRDDTTIVPSGNDVAKSFASADNGADVVVKVRKPTAGTSYQPAAIKQWRLDFGAGATGQSPSPWNTLTNLNSSTPVALKDDTDTTTAVTVTWAGFTQKNLTDGPATDFAPYPHDVNATKTRLYVGGTVRNPSIEGTIVLSGLTGSMKYDLDVFSGVTNDDGEFGRATDFVLGDDTKTVEAGQAPRALVTFMGVTPVNGSITLKVKVAANASSRYASINSLVLRENTVEYLKKAISVADATHTGLTIPPGTYYLRKPTETSSSHLYIDNKTNLAIDGHHLVTMVFQDTGRGVSIDNSQRLALKNMTLRYDGPRSVLGTFGTNNTLVVDQAFRSLLAATTTPTTSLVKAISLWNRAANRFEPSPNRELYNVLVNSYDPVSGVMALGNTYQFAANLDVVLRLNAYEGHAVRIGHPSSEDITLEGLRIESSQGMAMVVSQGRRGLHVKGCTVTRRSDEPVSVVADGLHISDFGGDVYVEGNIFEYQGDDGINLESTVYLAKEPSLVGGLTSFEVPDGYTGKQREYDFLTNETVALFDSTGAFIETATVVTNTDDTLHPRITLNKVISNPANVRAIRNLSRRNNRFLFEGNTIRHSRARGMLVQAPNGRLFDNTIHNTTMIAIGLFADQGDWWEGAGSDNVVLEKNVITNVGWSRNLATSSPDVGAITVRAVSAPGAVMREVIHRHVLLKGNTISGTQGPALAVMSSDNLRVEDNSFSSTNQAQSTATLGTVPLTKAVIVHRAVGVTFKRNAFDVPSTPIAVDPSAAAVVEAKGDDGWSRLPVTPAQGDTGWFFQGRSSSTPFTDLTWDATKGRWGTQQYLYLGAANTFPGYGGQTRRTFNIPMTGTYAITHSYADTAACSSAQEDDSFGRVITSVAGVETERSSCDSEEASCPNAQLSLALTAGTKLIFESDSKGNSSCDNATWSIAIRGEAPQPQ